MSEKQWCKLTDQAGYTQRWQDNETLWGENVTNSPKGLYDTPLCSAGVIHIYEHPLIAAFMNPVHAAIKNPLCWEVSFEGEPDFREGQLKSGCIGAVTTIKQIPLPEISTEQRVEIGIRCALTLPQPEKYKVWVEKWLSGEDRSEASALAAAAVADAAAAVAAAVADAVAASYASRADADAVAASYASRAVAVAAASSAFYAAYVDAASAAANYAAYAAYAASAAAYAAVDAAYVDAASAAANYAAYTAYAADAAAYAAVDAASAYAAVELDLLSIIKAIVEKEKEL